MADEEQLQTVFNARRDMMVDDKEFWRLFYAKLEVLTDD